MFIVICLKIDHMAKGVKTRFPCVNVMSSILVLTEITFTISALYLKTWLNTSNSGVLVRIYPVGLHITQDSSVECTCGSSWEYHAWG